MTKGTSLSPVLGYRDVDAAADWLCNAFGFKVHHADATPTGEVSYMALRLGAAYVIVSPAANLSSEGLFGQPDEVNGTNTQTCYLTVESAEEHCAKALASGADIVCEPQEDFAGNRFYSCRDLEGHLWTFGTGAYGAPAELAQPEAAPTPPPPRERSRRFASTLAAVSITLGALAAAGSYAYVAGGWLPGPHPSVTQAVAETVPPPVRKAPLVVTEVPASLLIQEQRTVVDLRETVRGLNTQLWMFGANQHQTEAALQAANTRVQQLLRLYDQAREEADRARQSAAVLQVGNARAATELTSQKAAAAQLSAALDQALAGKGAAELSVTEFTRRLDAQQLLFIDDRSRLDAITRRLTDELEIRKLLRQRIDQMTAAIHDLESQRSDAERSQNKLRSRLDHLTEALYFEHTSYMDSQQALLTARREIDDVHLRAAITPPPSPAAPPPSTDAGLAPSAAKVSKSVTDATTLDSQTLSVADLQRPAVPARKPAPQPASKVAAATTEFGRCVGQVMGGKLDWGGGRRWTSPNAALLCKGTRAAQATLDCFASEVGSGASWKDAIDHCRRG